MLLTVIRSFLHSTYCFFAYHCHASDCSMASKVKCSPFRYFKKRGLENPGKSKEPPSRPTQTSHRLIENTTSNSVHVYIYIEREREREIHLIRKL